MKHVFTAAFTARPLQPQLFNKVNEAVWSVLNGNCLSLQDIFSCTRLRGQAGWGSFARVSNQGVSQTFQPCEALATHGKTSTVALVLQELRDALIVGSLRLVFQPCCPGTCHGNGEMSTVTRVVAGH